MDWLAIVCVAFTLSGEPREDTASIGELLPHHPHMADVRGIDPSSTHEPGNGLGVSARERLRADDQRPVMVVPAST